MKRIFICGESWVGQTTHIKGADVMTTTCYKENIHWLKDALEAGDYEIDYMPSHIALKEFPNTVEKLQKYDLVILSDVGANTLLMMDPSFPGGERNSNSCDAIKEYVLEGGAFLMIGGFMSFTGIDGKARFGTTSIADILPVDLLTYDDRNETPQGSVPEIIEKDHEIFSGLTDDWKYFIGYNKTIENKEKGKVIAKFGEDPFIAVGEFGKGKSAVFTSDCAPHWASPAFLKSENYGKIWVNIADWLTTK